MKILTVSAHPDDWELGCFGTMTRLKSEEDEYMACKIEHLILGAGRGDNLDNQFDRLPLIHWVELVEDNIKSCYPDIIFTHYEEDLNIDHRITYQAVITATRPQPDCCVKEIYSFEILSSTEWAFPTSFSPDVFYGLTEGDIAKKWEILNSKYKNEMREWPHPRSYVGIGTLALYRGLQAGVKHAEAFKTVRVIR